MQPTHIELYSVGNPDRNEYFGNNVLSPDLRVKVSSLAEASVVARAYIEEYDLGAGNCPPFSVYDASKKVIGDVSYNGRVWKRVKSPEPGKLDDLELLYDPGKDPNQLGDKFKANVKKRIHSLDWLPNDYSQVKTKFKDLPA